MLRIAPAPNGKQTLNFFIMPLIYYKTKKNTKIQMNQIKSKSMHILYYLFAKKKKTKNYVPNEPDT